MNYSDDLRSRIEAQIAARRRGRSGRHADETDEALAKQIQEPAPLTSSPIAETQVIKPIPSDPAQAARLARRARLEQERRSTHHRHRRGRVGPRLGFPFRLLVLVGVAGVLALVLRTFVVEPFWIPSESMEPTLHGCSGCNNDRLLVDKLSYRLHAVHRGDVVVFHRPPGVNAAEKVLIKRVIGLPGETISGHDSKVWIGSRPLEESYVNPACHGTTDFDPVRIPSGRYFVMGDNRCDSADSRVFGPIPRSSIIGRAFLIIWPLGRVHWL